MLLALAAFSMLLLPTPTTLLLLKPGTHTPLTWSLVNWPTQHSPLETGVYNYGKIEEIPPLEYEGKETEDLMMEFMSLSWCVMGHDGVWILLLWISSHLASVASDCSGPYNPFTQYKVTERYNNGDLFKSYCRDSRPLPQPPISQGSRWSTSVQGTERCQASHPSKAPALATS